MYNFAVQLRRVSQQGLAVSKQYRVETVSMQAAVYNLAIPNIIPSSVNRASFPGLRIMAWISCALLGLATAAHGVDWSTPEQQLARKIAAVTGPATVGLTIENRSSLGKRDSEIIQNGLRSALEGLGIRSGQAGQASTIVAISLSENPSSYVWVAEIRQAGGGFAVVMVSAPRSQVSSPRESVPLSLRRISLWGQDDLILDVAVLEENSTPTRIAVLNAEDVALYRLISGKWQQELILDVAHAHPWPRDLRGRVIPAKDHLLDVYLPGVVCHSSSGAPVTLNCRDSDDPWPLVSIGLSSGSSSGFPSAGSTAVTIPPVGAFYASTRNFFTGALASGSAKVEAVTKFYSAAMLPHEKHLFWLFAGTDGHIHMVDGTHDQTTKLNWGSDLTSVKTSCGAGWQVIATVFEEGDGDEVRAYEFPDHDAVAVSAALDFPSGGVVTALWTEAKGDTAVAVEKNRETGSYEAFRLAVACSQ
jgi:hypothetical protein